MTGDGGRLRFGEAGEDLGTNSTIAFKVISGQSCRGLSVPRLDFRGRVLACSGEVRSGLVPLFQSGAGVTA